MAILVKCECGQQFQTRDENAGRRAKCPDCGRELIVPKPVAFGGEEFAPLDRSETVTSGKAIASLVLGICSLFCTLFTGIPAIILGALGLSDINSSHGRVKGSGMAITGIVLGALGSTVVLLVALLLPAVQAAREAARRSQCVNNLKQIGLAMHNYHSTWDCFPPAAITDENGKPLLSWRVAILPYLEQSSLYQQFHQDEPWDSPHNLPLASMMPMVYRCPSNPLIGPDETPYQVIVGPKTMFRADFKPVKITDITDGTSNTIMAAEARRSVTWTAPDDTVHDPTVPMSGLGSLHPGGFNTLFADGSVRFIKMSIASTVLDALFTRNGGEVVGGGSF